MKWEVRQKINFPAARNDVVVSACARDNSKWNNKYYINEQFKHRVERLSFIASLNIAIVSGKLN